MKRSATITVMGIVFTVCLLIITAGNTFSEEYSTLKGLKSVEAVFDFEQGDPQGALRRLNVINMAFKDKITGRQAQTSAVENRPSLTCAFPTVFFKPVHNRRMLLCTLSRPPSFSL